MPFFIMTIDTEGDNFWAKPDAITTENAAYLPRFQLLCEQYGVKPVYLTAYEMATCAAYCDFARDALRRHTAEVGMHLHAWNTPPAFPLTDNDARSQPYLIEYPAEIIEQKVAYLTALLEDTFGVRMASHRAGRWSFNGAYARALVRHGYTVDCSVTPHVSWATAMGDPAQAGGTDYRPFPSEAYWLDLADISRSGHSTLLEVPMTIVPNRPMLMTALGKRLGAGSVLARVLHRVIPPVVWLRPNGRNLPWMLRLLRQAVQERRDYVQGMLHSSELMPGGSPTFPTKATIEKLYADLTVLFQEVSASCTGVTLQEYHHHFAATRSGQSQHLPR
jgi:hypothetical protein